MAGGGDPGWVRSMQGADGATLQVSAIGFGASPLGGVFGPADTAECEAAVERGVARGINLFDTSPFYGEGKSEQMLGHCLATSPSVQAMSRDQLILCSKVGRYGPTEFDFSGERVRHSVFTSLERLGTSYLDIVHMHDVEFADLREVTQSALPALHQLQREGYVRNVGVSALPLSALSNVLHLSGGGHPPDVCLSYCRSNLLDQSFDRTLQPELQRRRVGSINASPLAMGLLTNAGPPPWHPAPTKMKQACARAAERCGNLASLALRACLARSSASCTLVGMRTAQEVDANVDAAYEALSGKWPTEMQQAFSAVEQELAEVQGMTWPSGLRENNDDSMLTAEQEQELCKQ